MFKILLNENKNEKVKLYKMPKKFSIKQSKKMKKIDEIQYLSGFEACDKKVTK